MNWFKRMVINWVREDWEHAHQVPEDCYPTAKLSRGINTVSTRDVNSDPTLQFKVYNAIGGKVVEFTRYDRKSDRADHQIYVINQDQDFGERIAKIATMENLKS